MSLVGYRTHSITLRAANMRRGVLVNSAAARRFAFFTESAKYLLQKSGSWILHKTILNLGGNHAELPNTNEIPKSDEKAEADM